MSPLRGCFSSPVQLRPPLIPRPSLLGLLLLELLVLLLEEEEQLSGSPGTHTSPSSSSTLPAEEHNEGREGGPVNDQPVSTAGTEPVGTRDGAEDPDRDVVLGFPMGPLLFSLCPWSSGSSDVCDATEAQTGEADMCGLGAAVAGIYQVAGKNMAPLEALVFGVGQTVLTVIISFSRVIATL